MNSKQMLAMTFFWAAPLAAQADPSNVVFFPNAHDLFQPLVADPRELQYSLRAVSPVSRKLFGDVAMGDYLGVVRWPVGTEVQMQSDVGGGVFARFDLAGSRNNMESADFYANIPIDVRFRKWSGRFMFFHTSSHLGDDYIASTGNFSDEKHSWDNLRAIGSYEWTPNLRLYGGYIYALRTFPAGQGRNMYQGGVETQTPWLYHHHARWYWANDYESWQRINWNPIFNSQAGIKVRGNTDTDRGMSLYIEYRTGHQVEGQFYLQEQTRWTLGLKFDLS